MVQKIVFDFPPIYKEIERTFPLVKRGGVIFAWGDTIFNPFKVDIPTQLRVHEQVHGVRQGSDVFGWWLRYLHEPEFRLVEETVAHLAEMKVLFGPNPNRQMKRRIILSTAKRLANPVYRYGCSRKKAEKLLKDHLDG